VMLRRRLRHAADEAMPWTAERAVRQKDADRARAACHRRDRVAEHFHRRRLGEARDRRLDDVACRLAGDDEPRASLAELDAVGDLDRAVDTAEARVADGVPRAPGPDAELGRAPARRRRLEGAEKAARIEENVEIRAAKARRVERLSSRGRRALAHRIARLPP